MTLASLLSIERDERSLTRHARYRRVSILRALPYTACTRFSFHLIPEHFKKCDPLKKKPSDDESSRGNSYRQNHIRRGHECIRDVRNAEKRRKRRTRGTLNSARATHARSEEERIPVCPVVWPQNSAAARGRLQSPQYKLPISRPRIPVAAKLPVPNYFLLPLVSRRASSGGCSFRPSHGRHTSHGA